MRLLKTIIALTFFAVTTHVASGQDLSDHTAVMTISVAGFYKIPGSIYLTKGTLFAQFNKSNGAGYVCPFSGPKTVTAVCTRDRTADCDGPYLDFRLKDNIETLNVSSCQATRPSPGHFCANVVFTEDHKGRRKSYHATGTIQACLTVEANGACSFSAERVGNFDGKTKRVRFKSTTCRMVPGRHL